MDYELEETCIECLDLLYSRRFCDDDLWIVYKTMMTLMHKLNPQGWADPSAELGFNDPWIHGPAKESSSTLRENTEQSCLNDSTTKEPFLQRRLRPKSLSPSKV